jgi:hypothetical protein
MSTTSRKRRAHAALNGQLMSPLLAILLALCCIEAAAQPVASPPPEVTIVIGSGSFNGKWTYRSYVNEPDVAIPPNDLLFGQAVIELIEHSDGTVSGSIGGPGWSLTLQGKAEYSAKAATVKAQGVGNVDSETWVYDYFGYLAPKWANGVGQ